MTIDPLYIFVFAGLFSPGPNVIMLTASGARFGFRATVPHILGVAVGVGITAGVTGLGVGAALVAMPQVAFVMKLAAAGWILWMAWQMTAVSSRPGAPKRDTPFTFFQAVLFQWINPKIWAVALVATSGYSLGLPPMQESLRMASAFSGINLFVCLFWAYAGSLLSYLLGSPRAWGIFLRVMGVMLGVSAVMIFL